MESVESQLSGMTLQEEEKKEPQHSSAVPRDKLSPRSRKREISKFLINEVTD
jgi:hypothetical protein